MSLNIEKVLISDKVDASCKDVFDKNNIACDYKPGISKDELKEIIKDYDALIVRSATKVTPDVLDCAPRLKVVGRAGTGVDNIDLNAASRKGVLVMNTPGGNTLSAAEHTCAMISALARHIGQGYASLREGKWERSKFMGCELMGKTLGIVGLGRIGREVASRMQSYGMKTVGFDPLVSKEDAATFGVEYLSLAEMWKVVDFVTVHVPLIKPTEGMINSKVFASCKKGMRVVNVARGGIIDEKDLLEALNSGNCGGAALDVFVTEPPKDIGLELVQHPKVLCTPHLGASTIEAQLRVAKEISEQIVDAVNGKPMVGLVNAPALGQMGNPVYQPWVQLGEKLGVIVSSLHENIKGVTILHSSDVLTPATNLLMSAVCYGIARGQKLEANMINGSSLLKEKGIEVKCAAENGSFPMLSLALVDGTKYSGILSGNTPAMFEFCSVKLSNPVTLDEEIVVCNPTSLSTAELLQKISRIDVQSVCLGNEGNDSVVVGKASGVLEASITHPFKLVKL